MRQFSIFAHILNGVEKTPLVIMVSQIKAPDFPPLLSIQEKSEARREIGLMLSFTRAIRHVYFSIIMALNLDPIKNLPLSEWLTSECEKAKEGNMPVCSNYYDLERESLLFQNSSEKISLLDKEENSAPQTY